MVLLRRLNKIVKESILLAVCFSGVTRLKELLFIENVWWIIKRNSVILSLVYGGIVSLVCRGIVRSSLSVADKKKNGYMYLWPQSTGNGQYGNHSNTKNNNKKNSDWSDKSTTLRRIHRLAIDSCFIDHRIALMLIC